MNIFVSDPCPIISAENLDDKRVIKMILESAQLLSNVMNIRTANGPYKLVHKNHPCTKWINEDKTNTNAIWLKVHMIRLCELYTKIYDKKHKCEELIPLFGDYFRSAWPLPDYMRNWQNCTTYKKEKDIFKAYKLYLCDKWDNDKRQPTWKKRGEPYFYAQHKTTTNSKKTEL